MPQIETCYYLYSVLSMPPLCSPIHPSISALEVRLLHSLFCCYSCLPYALLSRKGA